ncbi:MAG: hypothetical protein K9L68_03010 [Spirochaetales bacterium]|nr:hypothetical protein [Spirochaetales bacterium]MCF7937546.1 hypothetical protein [Spirochaetales bacterium]
MGIVRGCRYTVKLAAFDLVVRFLIVGAVLVFLVGFLAGCNTDLRLLADQYWLEARGGNDALEGIGIQVEVVEDIEDLRSALDRRYQRSPLILTPRLIPAALDTVGETSGSSAFSDLVHSEQGGGALDRQTAFSLLVFERDGIPRPVFLDRREASRRLGRLTAEYRRDSGKQVTGLWYTGSEQMRQELAAYREGYRGITGKEPLFITVDNNKVLDDRDALLSLIGRLDRIEVVVVRMRQADWILLEQLNRRGALLITENSQAYDAYPDRVLMGIETDYQAFLEKLNSNMLPPEGKLVLKGRVFSGLLDTEESN